MKRSNVALELSLLISLVTHLLAVLILVHVHREEVVRRTYKPVPVEFNVKAPPPRLELKKPKFEPVELNPERRSFNRASSPRFVKLDQKMDRTTAYRDIAVADESDAPPGVDIQEEGVNMGKILPSRSGARGAGPSMRGGRSQLVEFVDKSRGKRRIVYCMDVSASMGAANKLNLSRNYLKDSLLALNNKDTFNIIAFAKDARVFRPDMAPVTQENLTDAMRFLDDYTPQSIAANTKTDLLSVLIRAMEMRPNIVVMVTDGLPTSGVTQPDRILQSVRERNSDGRVRIFAIGMEMDLEQPEAWLLRAIAEQNKGEFQSF